MFMNETDDIIENGTNQAQQSKGSFNSNYLFGNEMNYCIL